MLESWQPGVEFVLVANPNWHGEPAKTDRLIFRVVPDASTRLSLLRSGEVDIARDIAPRDLQELETDPNITVYRFPSRVVSFIGMNATMPPFDDPLVRQGISYAIPYQTILDNALFGYAIPLTSVIPEGMATHTDEFFTYETDPERARELLAEAGYPEGLDVTFRVRSDLAESKAVGVWMKSELAKAGINVTIEELDGATFTGGLQRHEHAFFHHPGWLSINNDPFYHVSFLLQSECCNYTDYSNEEVDQLIEEFTISTDEEGRAEAASRIQEIAAEEAVWGLLYQPDTTLATRSDVKGVTYNPADRYWRYYLMYRE
jgi:peptide/nickel transport system substrate-binding protein